jgi:uncharacterized protein YegL
MIMPRIGMEEHQIAGSNFSFSGARIDNLGATEYTLVTIAVDETGSVYGFEKDLREAILVAVDACKRSPRSDNLLLRVVTFSTSSGADGVREIHGFKPLVDISDSDYPDLDPGGMTPLYDATFSSVGALVQYGQELMDNDFLANGIVFVITDGGDNASSTSPQMVRDEIEKVVRDEVLESLATVLIGINAVEYKRELEYFAQEAGLDQYIDVGDVTKAKLAKLANFISQSISSQSQALGTGGPSQKISATI